MVDTALKTDHINEFIECVEEHKNSDIPAKNSVLWPGVVSVLSNAKDLEPNHLTLVSSIFWLSLKFIYTFCYELLWYSLSVILFKLCFVYFYLTVKLKNYPYWPENIYCACNVQIH